MAKKATGSGLQAKRRETQKITNMRNAQRKARLGRTRGKTGGSRVRILPP
jgi:hypothetical protein